jgi:hypothetical protein
VRRGRALGGAFERCPPCAVTELEQPIAKLAGRYADARRCADVKFGHRISVGLHLSTGEVLEQAAQDLSEIVTEQPSSYRTTDLAHSGWPTAPPRSTN